MDNGCRNQKILSVSDIHNVQVRKLCFILWINLMNRYILESKPATRTVKLTLDYPTSSLCNNAGKMTLIDKVRQRIHALNNVWKICDKRSEIFYCIFPYFKYLTDAHLQW